MTKPSCIKCNSENCYINKYVNKEWKKKTDSKRITLSFKKGESVFREGEPVSGIYFIYQGKVKVYNSGFKNRTQIVRFADTGNILGHRGFGKTPAYPIGATVLENSTLCFIPKADFISAMNHNGGLATELVNFYADELRRAENKLRSISQLTVRQKMAEALLTVAEIYGLSKEKGVDFLNVVLTRQEYADITGASLEEVIRTISQLKKEKLILIEGKRIAILDKSKLEFLITEFGALRLP
ncbi:MAG: Crp/Fnr family transcriptional regulator [Bacteroidetes bacterium]|nr:Crp/Fnr family transcriptional regulator [Bacteroidota bacterium]